MEFQNVQQNIQDAIPVDVPSGTATWISIQQGFDLVSTTSISKLQACGITAKLLKFS